MSRLRRSDEARDEPAVLGSANREYDDRTGVLLPPRSSASSSRPTDDDHEEEAPSRPSSPLTRRHPWSATTTSRTPTTTTTPRKRSTLLPSHSHEPRLSPSSPSSPTGSPLSPPPHPLLTLLAASSSSSSPAPATASTSGAATTPSVTAQLPFVSLTSSSPVTRSSHGTTMDSKNISPRTVSSSSSLSLSPGTSDDDCAELSNDDGLGSAAAQSGRGATQTKSRARRAAKKKSHQRATRRPLAPPPLAEGGNCDDVDGEHRIMVQEMVSALSEAQTELRDAKREVEALQETCQALSTSLVQSEQEKFVLMERLELLELQMSSVCYVDLPLLRKFRDRSDNDAAAVGSSIGGVVGGGSPKKKKEVSATAKVVASSMATTKAVMSTATTPAAATAIPRTAAAGRKQGTPSAAASTLKAPAELSLSAVGTVSVSTSAWEGPNEPMPPQQADVAPGAAEDHDHVPSSSSPSTSESPSGTAEALDVDVAVGPTPPPPPSLQAAFYRALKERDHARESAERYRNEVKMRREQVRTLRRQLLQSATLIELSYQPQDVDDDDEDDDLNSSSGESDGDDNDLKIDNSKDPSAASPPSKQGSPIKKWFLSKRRGDNRGASKSPTRTSPPPPAASEPRRPQHAEQESVPASPLPLPSPPLAAKDDPEVDIPSRSTPFLSTATATVPPGVTTLVQPSNFEVEDQYIVDLFRPPAKDSDSHGDASESLRFSDAVRSGHNPSTTPVSRSSSSSSLSSDADMAAGGSVVPPVADKASPATAPLEMKPRMASTSSHFKKGASPRREVQHAMRPSEMVASKQSKINDGEKKYSSPRAIKGRLVEL